MNWQSRERSGFVLLLNRRLLEEDYRAMHQMFYQEPPKFAEVLKTLRALENEIRSTMN